MPLPPKHAYHTADEYPITVAMTDAVSESNIFHGDQKDAGDIERQQQRAHDRIEKMSFVRDFPAHVVLTVEQLACGRETLVKMGSLRQRRYVARCRVAATVSTTPQEAVHHMFYGGANPFENTAVRSSEAVFEDWTKTYGKILRLEARVSGVSTLQKQAQAFNQVFATIAEKTPQVWLALDRANTEANIVFRDIKKVVTAYHAAPGPKKVQNHPFRVRTESNERLAFTPVYVTRRLQDLGAILAESQDTLTAIANRLHLEAKLVAKRGTTDLQDTEWLDSVVGTKTAADVAGGVAGQQTEPGQSMGLAIGDRIQDQDGDVGQVQEVGVDGKINVKYDTGSMPAATYGPDAMSKGIIRRAVGETQDGDLESESIFGDTPENQGVTSFTQGASKQAGRNEDFKLLKDLYRQKAHWVEEGTELQSPLSKFLHSLNNEYAEYLANRIDEGVEGTDDKFAYWALDSDLLPQIKSWAESEGGLKQP